MKTMLDTKQWNNI